MRSQATTPPYLRAGRSLLLLACGLALCLLSGFGTAPPATAAADPIPVQVLGITDLHGYLSAAENQTLPGPNGTLQVGGVANMQTLINKLRAGRPNSFLIGSGDEFSGWPDYTQAFDDEPTIEVLNAMGLQFDVPGNHEFDREFPFLQRMMSGKCFGTVGVDSCFTDSTGRRFHGADYDYFSANIKGSDGQNVLAPYWVTTVANPAGGTIPIGFIGLTTPTTPTEQALSIGGSGFDFTDLARAANSAAAELSAKGVKTIIVSVHEGGQHDGTYDDCTNPSGPLFDAVKQMSPDIDAVLGGHWHTAFNCMLADPDGNPRPVMEAANHGKLVAEINLSIDPATGDVIRPKTRSANHPVLKNVTPDPKIQAIVNYWMKTWDRRRSAPLTRITADLGYSTTQESAMADFTADLYYSEAKHSHSGDADLAIIPVAAGVDVVSRGLDYAPSGDGDRPGRVLLGEAFGAVGISPIVTLTLTGRAIDAILEEQWKPPAYGCTRQSLLAVSANTHYTYDRGKPVGERVDPGSVIINGRPLDPGRTYRVATSAVMAVSYAQQGFPSFGTYTAMVRAPHRGQEVFLSYLRSHRRIEPPTGGRVHRIDGTPPPEEGPFGPLDLLDRSAVTATATSQGSSAYTPAKALDGSCSTMWHSAWSPYAPLPQSITLDLQTEHTVEAVVYTPRQDDSPNGRIFSYEVQTSTDGTTFTTVATGTWTATPEAKIARLENATSARYVRLVGTAGGADYASAAEVNIAVGES